jgi:hypothetical protein
MTLTDLMEHADELSEAIRIADEAFQNEELDGLSDQRRTLNLFASHLRPNTDAEAKFLQFRIAEYGEFLSEVPAHEIDRLNAIDAVRRMSGALAEYSNEQEPGQEAD